MLIVLSGPSGSGKTTIREALLEDDNNIVPSVSATTRPPREGEVNGDDYIFLHWQQFRWKISNGEFAEWASYGGNYYGTLKSTIDYYCSCIGKDVLLTIEVQGAQQIRQAYPDALYIFLVSPLEQLEGSERSGEASSESKTTERTLRGRYSAASTNSQRGDDLGRRL